MVTSISDISIAATTHFKDSNNNNDCKLPGAPSFRDINNSSSPSAAQPSEERILEWAVTRLQSVYRGTKGRAAATGLQITKLRDKELELELQALWQLLVTGFEVIKLPKHGRARKRILWLSLDGRLCVGRGKSNKYAGKCIFLGDITHIEKNLDDAAQFNNAIAIRETVKGKENQCLSIRASSSYGTKSSTDNLSTPRSFALMFTSHRVRNILAEKLIQLKTSLHGDQFGEFPKLVQKYMAHYYAGTGLILPLKEVKERIVRDGGGSTISDDFMEEEEGEASSDDDE